MIRIGDVDFDSSAIEDNRNEVIKLRDEALKQGDFHYAVVLSYTIALLAELLKRELTP